MATLQSMRDNAQGIVSRIIIGLIAISFAIFGFGSLVSYQSGGDTVVSVNDLEITEQEVARGINLRRRDLVTRLGQNVDESLLSDSALRPAVVEQLINQKLLLDTVDNAGLYFGESMVDKIIVSQPQFQQDGRFDPELFRNLVLRSGFSPGEYRSLLKEELLIGQLNSGFIQTAFVTPKSLEKSTQLAEQRRDIAYLRLPVANYFAEVKVSEEEISDYYQDNTETYRTEDQMIVEYIELNKDDLIDQVEVDEAEIEQEYEAQLAEFSAQEERRAAHILLEINDDRDEDQALALLNDLQSKLAQGEEFGSLAEQYSDDPGSKALQGDLGFASKGTFVPEFEQALFELQPNEVSSPIKTQFGVHLIKLLEVKESNPPSFGELAGTIERELRDKKAVQIFIDRKATLTEVAYEAGDLSEPANAISVTVSTSDAFSINQGAGIASNAKIRKAAFSDTVRDGINSELIEINENYVVVLRQKEFIENRIRDLSEVKDEITGTLTANKAKQAVKTVSLEIIDRLKQGEAATNLAESLSLEWQVFRSVKRNEQVLTQEVLDAAFKLKKPSQGNRTVADLQAKNGDVYILSVANVIDGGESDLLLTETQQLKSVLERTQGRYNYDEFRLALKKNANIERQLDSL